MIARGDDSALAAFYDATSQDDVVSDGWLSAGVVHDLSRYGHRHVGPV